jgi:hypothetical protein
LSRSDLEKRAKFNKPSNAKVILSPAGHRALVAVVLALTQ